MEYLLDRYSIYFSSRLEESESQNRKLNHSLKQKETKVEGLEKR